MLFNSFEFGIFLPIVFGLYWSAARLGLQIQNGILLLCSYFFYSQWDSRFLILLIFSTVLDYVTGLKIAAAESDRAKKVYLFISIFINLGFLGVFKYYNFFASSFSEALSRVGLSVDPWTIQVILPVGISFYTFHGISYIVDVYRNRIKEERSFVDYSLFVSFFPLLVAGPIERATHLLPQLKVMRSFDYKQSVDGLRQMLWGLFKKIVIADQCAVHVNAIFKDPMNHSGSTLLLGAVLFAFQIYGDFSGYSDIALGTARLFGIELLRNFATPYFSRNIAEFWRRWHISLSSWFKDYLYIPLGGSRVGRWGRVFNAYIIFLVSGFWHGANWTYLVWGLLNAIYITPSVLLNRNRKYTSIAALGKLAPSVGELFSMMATFSLTVLAWIVFRSESLLGARLYISGIFKPSLFSVPETRCKVLLGLIGVLLLIEWVGRERSHALAELNSRYPLFVRWGGYYTIAIAVFCFHAPAQQFIYFQF
jgi:alginate O-acetyltransferase complex protein AlgI